MAKRTYSVYKYKCHPSLDYYICIYCEMPGDSRDHVPPKCLVNGEHDKWIVRACRSCNNKLGRKPIYTIEDRREYLKLY